MLSDLAAEEDLLFLLAVGDRTEAGHSKLAHHLSRKLGCLLDVVRSAGRHVIEENLFGDSPAHHYRDLTFEVIARVRVAIRFRQLHRHSERHPAGDDRDFVNRVRVWNLYSYKRVAAFVISRVALLFIGHHDRAAFRAHQHFVLGPLEVVHRDCLLVVTRGAQRSFVDEIRQIGAGESGCTTSHNVYVYVVTKGDLASVNCEDSFAAFYVGPLNDNTAVKSSRSEQRWIEHV